MPMNNLWLFIKAKKVFFLIIAILLVLVLLRQILLHPVNAKLSYTVKRESLVDTVQATGTFTVAQQKQVLSPAKGIITQLSVGNNQQVKKGDMLFHVDSTATEDEKLSAFADYQEAISDMRTAQQTKQGLDATMWTKQQALLNAQNNEDYKNNNKDITDPKTDKNYNDLEKRSIDSALTQAQKDFSAAEQKYKEADIAISAAQAKVAKTKRAYDETKSTTMTAPTTGTVVNLLKTVGDEVSSSVPVLIIVDFANPVVTVTLNEAYMSRIAVGQEATIVFDAMKSKTFTGSIQTLDTVGTEVDGAVTYNARVVLSELDPLIRPNMTGLVTIETLRQDNVLTVPNSAIIEKDGKTYVNKIIGDSEMQVAVTLGTKGLSKTEITSGLEEGAVIVADTHE